MRRLILLLFTLFSVLSMKAQNNLCLHMKDGTKVVKYISDIDSLTFDVGLSDLISVAVEDCSEIRASSARVRVLAKGEISQITSIGVCYATNEDDVNEKNGEFVSYDGNYSNVVCLLDNLLPEQTYYYKGYVKCGDLFIFSGIKSFTTANNIFPVADAIDLGLNVLWSSWNMGAFSPMEYGGYYGWGDSTGELRSSYFYDYAKDFSGSSIAGTDYDIAHVKWGGKWRMPTQNEIDELCKLTWESTNDYNGSGIPGWILKAENGNSIFIPFAGYSSSSEGIKNKDRYAYMWSADKGTQNSHAVLATLLMPQYVKFSDLDKSYWISVRPVYDPHFGEDPEPLDEREVDLGLSVNWASCNIGSSSPADYGDYFAWGETETKDVYSISNYKYYGQELGDNCDIQGTEYDVANAIWGNGWVMPSYDEMVELVEKCSWSWSSYEDKDKNGNVVKTVDGYRVVGPNGNQIFLPAGGFKYDDRTADVGLYGNYFSSYMYVPREDNLFAYTFFFGETTKPTSNLSFKTRSYGLPVRPVRKKSK